MYFIFDSNKLKLMNMNRKFFSFVVAFVTMFGCLGSVQAQEYTVTLNQSSNKAFTGENGGVTFSITNLGNWENAAWFGIGDRHYAGYEVASETNSVISWQVPSNLRIKLSKVEVKATAASGSTRKRNIDLYTSKSTDANCISVTCAGEFNEAKTLTLSDYNKYFDGIGNDGTITIQHSTQKMYIYSVEIKYELEDCANLKIKAGCYGTFVAPFDVALPEGVVAYSVASSTADKATLSPFTLNAGNVLPAGNPVIVKHESGTAVDETYYGPFTTTESVINNGLLGFYKTGLDVTDGCYVLQDQGSGQKFYVVNNEKSEMKSAKNRCCLPADGTGAKVLSLSFAEGEETAVGAVSANATVVGYYSVNGAKFSAPKAGINLVKMSNGTVKKVFVK